MIYYISSNATGNGLSPETPRGDFNFEAKSGDFILFRRGSIWRGSVPSFSGVTYGAYGNGENPIICGSVDLSSTDLWEEYKPNIWRCTNKPNSDAGNFIFGEGDARIGATLRWNKEDLKAQGEFWDSCYPATDSAPETDGENELLLWSERNPAEYYNHIECCVRGGRILLPLQSGMTVENLTFVGSGIHAVQGSGKNITVRNCKFEFIGGCTWSRNLRIRFGNCIEFWDFAEDITVEGCSFYQVYDSCVTHQGGIKCKPAVRFMCRNNVFDSYGMAAFEYRDRVPVDSVFADNICKNAGVGFAMFGEILPRKSEIWPQPMGHHLFFWRMENPSDGGFVSITGNLFESAPVGAAIYSIISPDAESQLHFADNRYSKEMLMCAHIDGKDYKTSEEFLARQ